MNKDLTQVFACTTLSHMDISNIPKEDLRRITKTQLSRELAHFIMEHMDELPINYKKEQEFTQYSPPSEKHTVRINLISDEELHRLREIEMEYNRMRFYPNL